MKLFIEPKMWGISVGNEELKEMTPEFLNSFIENAKVFEIINFDSQVIANLVMEFPSNKERINAFRERYNVTVDQAKLALEIPLCETPLYFFREEYYRQIERLKTLRQIMQEVHDVIDE